MKSPPNLDRVTQLAEQCEPATEGEAAAKQSAEAAATGQRPGDTRRCLRLEPLDRDALACYRTPDRCLLPPERRPDGPLASLECWC